MNEEMLRAPRAFVEDFLLVVDHYRCSPEETELMKACARADLNAAQICFAELAREIRALTQAQQRMRTDARAECR